jgi:hypothetical protein
MPNCEWPKLFLRHFEMAPGGEQERGDGTFPGRRACKKFASDRIVLRDSGNRNGLALT